MNCLSAHEPYRKVVFMKGAQVGATEAGSNFIGYVMHISPAPIMMVQPTEEMVKKISKGRIDTLVAACPELLARVSMKKSRDGENTITQKNFHGGTLFLTGANSAAGLRSVPIRYLILDEVDSYPQDLDGEGSPIELAVARTRTFPNKKIFIISTPTISGMSAIEREFLETDRNYYHVPCPHCGGMQKLVFEQLKWEEGKPEAAKYCCAHCGALIEERHKVVMLAGGRWVPEAPERASYSTIGFHINSLYSPYGWQSWGEIADEFVKAKHDHNRLKTFVNTTLGETWAEKGEAPPYRNLYNRREGYPTNEVPEDVCFLTAGVDVQRDRLELEVVGWCADKRSYSIDYRVLEGDTAATGVWDKLSAVVGERWMRGDGMELPLRLMAVDTGYNTTHVHAFCRRFDATRVVPIKGMDSLGMAVAPPRTVDITKAGKRVGKLRQWNIGVSFLKSELYAALRLERDAEGTPPPSYCHFPQYDEGYFRGLTAEEQVKKIVRGYPRYEWKKVYERNEPLDCRVYARAAATIVGLDRLSSERLAAMGGVAHAAPKRTTTANGEAAAAERPTRERRKRSGYWEKFR
jgi:phage terminase large subunit GpA-like protein